MKNNLINSSQSTINNNSIRIKETIFSKFDDQNNNIHISESIIMNDKKVTIKDLCQEDKAKIGELIKKLAQEKEEKENLKVKLETEKKQYESRIEQISKENISVIDYINQDF